MSKPGKDCVCTCIKGGYANITLITNDLSDMSETISIGLRQGYKVTTQIVFKHNCPNIIDHYEITFVHY